MQTEERNKTKKPETEVEKYAAYGDPFYPRRERHFRGQRTFHSSSPVHPALILGEWPSDYLAMGMTIKTPKNAKERKKSIPLAHEKSPAGKQGRLLKAINVRNKKAFSSVTYKGHALTAEEHAAVDQQIEKKRRYWRKQTKMLSGQPTMKASSNVESPIIKAKGKTNVKTKPPK